MTDETLSVLLFAGPFELRGTSAYTLRLVEHLPEQGIQAQVVCPDASRVSPERRARLPIAEYPRITAPLVGRLVLHLLQHDLADDPPDLIHIQARNALTRGAWLAERLDRPYVLTVHDYLPPRESLVVDPHRCRKIISVSTSVRDALISRTGLPEDLFTVIPSGVDVRDDDPATRILEPGRVPVVGTAGPLEAVKGIPYFLEAARQIRADGRDVEFLVAGAGPEEARLRRLARELGLAEHVTFLPNLYDLEVALRAMDIYCLPSLQQGLGTIMLEAMSLGKPVIASGVGGVYSVVRDEETGLVVPPCESGRLAARIIELLDQPQKAREIGEAARRMVRQRFPVNRMVQQTADLYRDVLAATATAGSAA